MDEHMEQQIAQEILFARLIDDVDPVAATLVPKAEISEFIVLNTPGLGGIKLEKKKLPSLNPTDIQIRVFFGGLNFSDLYKTDGKFLEFTPLPATLGMECSGKVEAVGSYVRDIQPGDYVVCFNPQGGLFGSTVVVKSRFCYKIRRDQLIKAVMLPVAYMTAYLTIFKLGHLKRNQAIFLHSIGGSVGLAAVDVASRIPGVRIYGTCSSNKVAGIRKRYDESTIKGIFEYENWEEELFKAEPGGVDLAVDVLGGPVTNKCMNHVRAFGTTVVLGVAGIVNSTPELEKEWLKKGQEVSTFAFLSRSCKVGGLHLGNIVNDDPHIFPRIMTEILEMVDNHKLEPNYHSIMSFRNIQSALKLLLDRQNIGKIILKFDSTINSIK